MPLTLLPILLRRRLPDGRRHLTPRRTTSGDGSTPSSGTRSDALAEPRARPVSRTTSRPARPAPRAAARLSRVRAGLGTAHLLFPALAGRLLAGQPFDDTARVLVRVLGARQLTQALATGGQPTAAVLALGAVVDAAHAASMLTLGLVTCRWRRAALLDALIAAGFAIAGATAARAGGLPAAPTGLRARRDRTAERLACRLVPGYSLWSANPAES